MVALAALVASAVAWMVASAVAWMVALAAAWMVALAAAWMVALAAAWMVALSALVASVAVSNTYLSLLVFVKNLLSAFAVALALVAFAAFPLLVFVKNSPSTFVVALVDPALALVAFADVPLKLETAVAFVIDPPALSSVLSAPVSCYQALVLAASVATTETAWAVGTVVVAVAEPVEPTFVGKSPAVVAFAPSLDRKHQADSCCAGLIDPESWTGPR